MRDEERRNLCPFRKGLVAQIWLAWLTPGAAMYIIFRFAPEIKMSMSFWTVVEMIFAVWCILSTLVGIYVSYLDEFLMIEARELTWARMIKKSLLFIVFQIPISVGFALLLLGIESSVRNWLG